MKFGVWSLFGFWNLDFGIPNFSLCLCGEIKKELKMADKFVSERNLRFLLYEVFDAPKITQYPYYAEHSRESFDMALDTAMKIGKNLMKPSSRR